MFGRYAFGDRPFGSVDDERVFITITMGVSVNFEYTIYSATSEFATRPDDDLSSQPFSGTLQLPLNFKRSILGGDGIGVFTTGDGELDIANADGFYDFLIQQYAIDGREIVVKVGRLITNANGESFDNHFVVFKGTAADWNIDESVVHFILRDYGYKLNVPAQPNLYGGTGGADGGPDLAGKRKPRALGPVQNVSPPLLAPAALYIYQVNDGPVSDMPAVYDRGAVLTQSTDYATYALLAAASPAPGLYITCKAQGLFRIGGSGPAGTVTADVLGDATGGYIYTTADIVRRLVTAGNTGLTAPGDLYLPSFMAVGASQPSPVGYWLGPDDTNSVADVVGNLMAGIGGWGGFRRDGKFELGIFVAPAGIPVARYDKTDIIGVPKREPLPSGLSPPPWRQQVAYQWAWTTQTDLAGTVSASRRAFVAEQYRLAESSDPDVQTNHPFAPDPGPVLAYFLNQADAQAEADRRLALYKGARALFRMSLPVSALSSQSWRGNQRHLSEVRPYGRPADDCRRD